LPKLINQPVPQKIQISLNVNISNRVRKAESGFFQILWKSLEGKAGISRGLYTATQFLAGIGH
jgi:hypothetical protein